MAGGLLKLRRSSKSSVRWDSEVMEESGLWKERCGRNETESVVEFTKRDTTHEGCFFFINFGGLF